MHPFGSLSSQRTAPRAVLTCNRRRMRLREVMALLKKARNSSPSDKAVMAHRSADGPRSTFFQ
jgi:hypothetical protein